VAERIQPRGPEGSGGWLESTCKLIISLRAGILLVTVLMLPRAGDRQLLGAAIVLAGAASMVPLRFWSRVGPQLVRHPGYLAAELVLATVILLFTGVQSAFFYYTLATALLGGLLYGWPGVALFSPMLIGVYYWVLDLRGDVDGAAGLRAGVVRGRRAPTLCAERDHGAAGGDDEPAVRASEHERAEPDAARPPDDVDGARRQRAVAQRACGQRHTLADVQAGAGVDERDRGRAARDRCELRRALDLEDDAGRGRRTGRGEPTTRIRKGSTRFIRLSSRVVMPVRRRARENLAWDPEAYTRPGDGAA
jgi:hypothetical protein